MASSGLLFSRILRYSTRQQEQLELAQRVSEHVPKDSDVFIHGQYRYLYILNNYKNPFLSTIGYNYLFRDINSLLKLSDATILTEKRFPQADSVATEIKTRKSSFFIYRPTQPAKATQSGFE
jgi:hypothetical protein